MISVNIYNKPYFDITNDTEYLKYINNNIMKGVINLNAIKDILPSYNQNTQIPNTILVRKIKKILTNNFPKRGSSRCIDYWVVRGYTEQESIQKVSDIQKCNSPRSTKYWTARGYSEQQSVEEVSKIQDNASLKHFESKYNKEEALSKYKEHCAKLDNSSLKYFQSKFGTELGLTKYNEKCKANSYGNSLERYIKDYGVEVGTEKHTAACKKHGNFGIKNGQYGKPAPKGSGRGISGYYKKYYFRSLFEYHAIKYFEKNDITFIELDKQNTTNIRVQLDNNRTYRPDFLINNKTIIEVKPSGLIHTDINQQKMNRCIEQYPEYEYKFITENDIEMDIVQLKQDVKNKVVVIDKGKIHRYEEIYK